MLVRKEGDVVLMDIMATVRRPYLPIWSSLCAVRRGGKHADRGQASNRVQWLQLSKASARHLTAVPALGRWCQSLLSLCLDLSECPCVAPYAAACALLAAPSRALCGLCAALFAGSCDCCGESDVLRCDRCAGPDACYRRVDPAAGSRRAFERQAFEVQVLEVQAFEL